LARMEARAAGTVTLVTGGVRGLGLAVARRCRARGDVVHVGYRSSSDLARELEREFPERVHHADALVESDWRDLLAAIAERDGGVDHWVHAVGEYVHGELASVAPEDLRRMLASNVESAFL